MAQTPLAARAGIREQAGLAPFDRKWSLFNCEVAPLAQVCRLRHLGCYFEADFGDLLKKIAMHEKPMRAIVRLYLYARQGRRLLAEHRLELQ